MTNLQEAHRAFPSCHNSVFHTHATLGVLLESQTQKGKSVCVCCVCVCVRGCGPFSEATLRRAVCFFENSSYPSSPVPHRRKATGNFCQRTREDAIYSTLLLVRLRMKEANTERGSGVQPVQRHWDSSKSEPEREPERKEGELEKEE